MRAAAHRAWGARRRRPGVRCVAAPGAQRPGAAHAPGRGALRQPALRPVARARAARGRRRPGARRAPARPRSPARPCACQRAQGRLGGSCNAACWPSGGAARGADGACAQAEAVCLTPGMLSASSPRFSLDGGLLAFLSHEAAAASGVHCATAALLTLPWPPPGPPRPAPSTDSVCAAQGRRWPAAAASARDGPQCPGAGCAQATWRPHGEPSCLCGRTSAATSAARVGTAPSRASTRWRCRSSRSWTGARCCSPRSGARCRPRWRST